MMKRCRKAGREGCWEERNVRGLVRLPGKKLSLGISICHIEVLSEGYREVNGEGFLSATVLPISSTVDTLRADAPIVLAIRKHMTLQIFGLLLGAHGPAIKPISNEKEIAGTSKSAISVCARGINIAVVSSERAFILVKANCSVGSIAQRIAALRDCVAGSTATREAPIVIVAHTMRVITAVVRRDPALVDICACCPCTVVSSLACAVESSRIVEAISFLVTVVGVQWVCAFVIVRARNSISMVTIVACTIEGNSVHSDVFVDAGSVIVTVVGGDSAFINIFAIHSVAGMINIAGARVSQWLTGTDDQILAGGLLVAGAGIQALVNVLAITRKATTVKAWVACASFCNDVTRCIGIAGGAVKPHIRIVERRKSIVLN
mmetsp:Transcript_62088/g.128597  ORF Transcript_62088/g.128597 Transcript_62088/m.128597 type:complete len:377 (-) Transcript_62088:862-1992(-)